MWGEQHNGVFRGVERVPSEIWFTVRYHVSLWGLNSKAFCNLFYRCYFCIVGSLFIEASLHFSGLAFG